MIRQDFNLNRINATTNPAVAGQQIQIIIPANNYECSSIFEVSYVVAAQNAIVVHRPEFAMGIAQCQVQWDGLQRGIYQYLPQCQLSYYRRYMQNDDSNKNTTSSSVVTSVFKGLVTQKYRQAGIIGSTTVIARYPIKQFLAGLFHPQQKFFHVSNQLVITLQVNQITGVLALVDANGLLGVSVDATSINLSFLAKVCPGEVQIQPEIRQIQQYQYTGSGQFGDRVNNISPFTGVLSCTPVQNIPADQICDYIMMDFISTNSSTVIVDAVPTINLPPDLFSIDSICPISNATINKNGYNIIQSTDLITNSSQDFKAQLALSLNEKPDYNCYGGVYEYFYSNFSIQHNVTLNYSTNVATNVASVQRGISPINFYIAYSLLLSPMQSK